MPRKRVRKPEATAWERRKAEQAARKAAVMADPVQGFYLRHGRPQGCVAPEPSSAAAVDEEPGQRDEPTGTRGQT